VCRNRLRSREWCPLHHGTLEQRIRHCIDNPISGGIVLSQVRVQQLRGLLDVLAAEEV